MTWYSVETMDNDKVELSTMRSEQRVTKSGGARGRNSWAHCSHIIKVLARGQLVRRRGRPFRRPHELQGAVTVKRRMSLSTIIPEWRRPTMLAASGRKNTLSGASAESAGAWQNEVAERRPFSASTVTVFGSEIANRNSLRGILCQRYSSS